MTDYGGKIGEILHDLSRFVALLCRFRRCFDHRIARHGMRTFHGPAYTTPWSKSAVPLLNIDIR